MKHNLLNHTPGPWYVEGDQTSDGKAFLTISGEGPFGEHIADLPPANVNAVNVHPKTFRISPKARANAALIAAAPEMYHALVAYRRAREDGGISMADYSTIAHDLLMKVLDKVENPDTR
jgi:hypothetical protein